MHVLAAIVGAVLFLLTALDVLENIIVPKRMHGRFRLTAVFYRSTWKPWRALARRISDSNLRERYLSFYGPLSLLILFGLWAVAIIVAFGLLQWSAGLQFAPGRSSLAQDIFFSSTSFFNLLPAPAATTVTRLLMMLESAIGFGFLGLLISYLPVLYQAFSRREVGISMLDARAGSPATAGALLVRQGRSLRKLDSLLEHWEELAAELLESHLSYPVLAYFRSHHDNQSWLGSLTAILDTSALLSLSEDNEALQQAQLTFAMARHAVVDLANVFKAKPRRPAEERLPQASLQHLLAALRRANVPLQFTPTSLDKLAGLRIMYEPYVHALAEHFLMALPPWLPDRNRADNWLITAWGKTATPFAASDPFQAESEQEAA